MKIKDVIIKLVIGSLIVTGVLVIGMILLGDTNDFISRTMGTTWAISLTGLASLVHVKLLEKNIYEKFAVSSLVMMFASFISQMLGIWFQSYIYNIEEYLTAIVVYSIFSLIAGLILNIKMKNNLSSKLMLASAISFMVQAIGIIFAIFGISEDDLSLKLFLISMVVSAITLVIAFLINNKK